MTHLDNPSGPISARRYDIDWLRVLAFILLIFYHIGMFYVSDWGWHVKSAYQSELLQDFMLLLNQWRMPLIFLISGIALALVEPKISRLALLKMRFVRVFVPLVIGMYLIVPPQLYYQLIQNEGFSGNYWQFMSFYIDPVTSQYPQLQHRPIGLLTWNHLWYLAYLWHYTLIYLVLKPVLMRCNWQQLFAKRTAWTVFLILVFLLTVYGYWLKPIFPKTNALLDDWYNHAMYFTIFLFGYILAKSNSLWQKIIDKRRSWFTLAVINYLWILVFHYDLLDKSLRALGVDVDALDNVFAIQFAIQFIVYVNVVSWLFCVVGYAGQYLNRPSRALSYLNEAVLPWYILHQSVIIIIAMQLASWSLGPVIEPLLLIIATMLICGVCYELLKRFNLSRFMFGMRLKQKKQSAYTEQVFASN